MIRFPRPFLFTVLLLPFCLGAYKRVAVAEAERFDAHAKTWTPLPARLDWDRGAGQARLLAQGVKSGQPLTARLDFKRLPHYAEWVAQRQAEGGASWAALDALLKELGDGPAVAVSQGPVPVSGPLTLMLGLRRGTQFEPFATVSGPVQISRGGLLFSPGEPVFSRPSAALAWQLLKPLALRQLP
jgi:hypothetical protein